MQFKNMLFALAAVAVSVEAAEYNACKCHSSKTGLQVDWATESACNEYRDDLQAKVRYSNPQHHACIPNTKDFVSGDTIDNGDFQLKCYKLGDDLYQYCWGKKSAFS